MERRDIIQFVRSKEKEIKLFFVLFYFVGIIGLLLPISNALFLQLIPFALVLSFLALVTFYTEKIYKKAILVFIGIYATSFIIEAIGVNTGLIFGNYTYGNSLGIQLFHTPLIIGLNWLFLVYTSASVVDKLKIHTLLKILLAASIMLVYDIFLEQVAPKIDMWHWQHGVVPFKNYIAWFLIAILFHSLVKAVGVNTSNKLAKVFLIIQFVFFLILFIFIH